MSTVLTARRALEIYCDAFARRAADEIESLFAADAVYDLPLQDGRIHGCDHIMREIRTALRGLKNIEVQLEHVLESGDSVSCAADNATRLAATANETSVLRMSWILLTPVLPR